MPIANSNHMQFDTGIVILMDMFQTVVYRYYLNKYFEAVIISLFWKRNLVIHVVTCNLIFNID